MAGVTVDSVIVSVEARIAKYEADMEAAAKKTEAIFARMRKASAAPIVPKVGAVQNAGAEAAAVEKSEGRKQRAKRQTAEAEEKAQARISTVIQRTIERDNARAAAAETASRRVTAAYDRETAAKQTRLMSTTALSRGNVGTSQPTGNAAGEVAANRETIKRIDLENRLAEAKAAGAAKSTRALQDQIEKLRLIERYQRAGLNATDAKAKAEQRLTSIITARQRREEQAARAEVERSLRRNNTGLGAGLRAAAGGLVAGIGVAEISALNDKYIEFTNRLKIAGVEGANLATVQERLLATANKNGVELGSLASVFQKATEAGKEFGATQAQALQFTDAVSNAVKIQGGGVESARGALLQLGQALQEGTVRAQEFNSLLEGLYPLLQAAAGASDQYGGSVAKLRAAVIEGKVSSQEFFNLILKGSEILEQRAAKATLTTAAGFQALTNSLVVYFGEADKANGVSAALGEALGAIARNLDTLIPAIAAVTVAIGVRYVAAAIAAGRATAGLGAALTLLARHPVILAITAIAGALTYMTLTSGESSAELDKLAGSVTSAEDSLRKAEERAKGAGVAIDKIGTNAANAAGKVDKLALSLSQAAHQSATLAAQEKIRELQDVAKRKRALDRERQNLIDEANPGRAARLTKAVVGDNDPFVQNQRRVFDSKNPINTNTEALRDNTRKMQLLAREENIVSATPIKAFVPPPSGVTGGGAAGGETAKEKRAREAAARKAEAARKRAEREAIKAEREQARDETQDRQAQIEILRARQALTGNVQERAEFELQMLAIEKAQRVADVANDKTLSAQERAARLKYIETLYGPVNTDPNAISVGSGGLLQRGVDRETQKQIDEDAAEIADRLNSIQQEKLRDELDAAPTRRERARIQSELLDLEIKERTAALEREKKRALDEGRTAQAAAIQTQIDALPSTQQRGQAAINRENEGPLAQYARTLREGDTAEMAEQFVVDQLKSVQDGITGALQNAIGTKDPLIGSLLNLLVQEVIMKPLAQALASANKGGGGIGGLLSSAASAFGLGGGKQGTAPGRASGGNVVAGSLYRVNEGGSNIEGFRPAQSGQIIPLGRMNAQQRSATPQTVIVKVEANDYFDARVDKRATGVAVPIARQASTQGAAASYAQGQQSTPGTLNKFQQLRG